MSAPARNLPLALGVAMLLVALFVAAFGPALAPRDPTDLTYVLNIGGVFVRPPFPPFAAPEFPLGSDSFGRDTLSQLLWAVRPTLVLVGLVLAARLALGAGIGMLAGWSGGRAGRIADGLIAVAISVPVLIVALAAIALLQNRLGAVAFVIGLSITGWAEVARVIREQARLVKGQQYIEAARALGLSEAQIALRHVWRQLLPTLALTSAFEAAGVLLTLAALGFLGTYVGGSNWVMVGDFAARRISGLPELGQMLSSAASIWAAPAGMLIVGAAVAFIVAAFMLIGEGLRIRLMHETRRRSRLYEGVLGFVEDQQVEQRVRGALAQRRTRARLAFGAAAFVLLGGGALTWALTRPPTITPSVAVPGGHAWSGDRRDPEGTLRAPGTLAVQAAPTVTWAFDAGADLAGGPAVSRDGVIYIASRDKVLHALDAAGNELWRAALNEAPVGAPGIAPDGGVLVVDEAGGVSRLSPQGALEWTRPLDPPALAISGPIVDDGGDIYYAVEGGVVSMSADGEPRWRGRTPYTFFSPTPLLERGSGHVFFKDVALSAADGSTVLEESIDPLDQFIAGDDGRIYRQAEANLMEWRASDEGIALAEVAKWDYTKRYPGVAVAGGGALAEGGAWLLLGNEFTPGRLAWFRPGGELLGSIRLPFRGARVIAADERNTIVVCGSGGQVGCAAVAFGTDRPLWEIELPGRRGIVGGALVGGRLLVAAADGKLFAVGM